MQHQQELFFCKKHSPGLVPSTTADHLYPPSVYNLLVVLLTVVLQEKPASQYVMKRRDVMASDLVILWKNEGIYDCTGCIFSISAKYISMQVLNPSAEVGRQFNFS